MKDGKARPIQLTIKTDNSNIIYSSVTAKNKNLTICLKIRVMNIKIYVENMQEWKPRVEELTNLKI